MQAFLNKILYIVIDIPHDLFVQPYIWVVNRFVFCLEPLQHNKNIKNQLLFVSLKNNRKHQSCSKPISMVSRETKVLTLQYIMSEIGRLFLLITPSILMGQGANRYSWQD